MKKLFVCLTLVLAACSKDNSVKDGMPVRIPWTDENGKFSYQVKVLKGVRNSSNMSGEFASFMSSGSVKNGILKAIPPEASFRRDGEGVFVPVNVLSGQMAALYYHAQQMSEFDKKLDVHKLLNWPLRYYLVADVRTYNGTNENALYDGDYDLTFFAPTTSSNVPLTMNPGIVAHEHFHNIFFRLLIQPLIESKIVEKSLKGHGSVDETSADEFDSADVMSIHNAIVLRGVNEGLADYWGYAYSQNVGFVSQTFPNERAARSLEFEPVKPITLADLQAYVSSKLPELQKGEKTFAKSYEIGTFLARTLRSLESTPGVKTKSNEKAGLPREEILKLILKNLATYKEKLVASYKKDFLDPLEFANLIAHQVNPNSVKIGEDANSQKLTDAEIRANLRSNADDANNFIKKERTQLPVATTSAAAATANVNSKNNGGKTGAIDCKSTNSNDSKCSDDQKTWYESAWDSVTDFFKAAKKKVTKWLG